MNESKPKKVASQTPFEKQLEHVSRTYNLSPKDTFTFLIAVLQCYQFNVVEAGQAREWGEEGSEYQRCNGPYVWIQATDAPAIIARFDESLSAPAKSYLRHKLWLANIRAQEKLIRLLDKFYEGKKNEDQ